jgi:hypothetical protein
MPVLALKSSFHRLLAFPLIFVWVYESVQCSAYCLHHSDNFVSYFIQFSLQVMYLLKYSHVYRFFLSNVFFLSRLQTFLLLSPLFRPVCRSVSVSQELIYPLFLLLFFCLFNYPYVRLATELLNLFLKLMYIEWLYHRPYLWWGGMVGLIWLRTGTCRGPLWTRQWTFRFHKILKSSLSSSTTGGLSRRTKIHWVSLVSQWVSESASYLPIQLVVQKIS